MRSGILAAPGRLALKMVHFPPLVMRTKREKVGARPSAPESEFAAAVGPVMPLRAKPVVTRPRAPVRVPTARSAPTPVLAAPLPAAVAPTAALSFRRPGVQERELRALRGNAFSAQDECDLHGLDALRAHAVLEHFIAQAAARGLRRVRVVHGRGRGVLKSQCVATLSVHPAVLAFVSAGTADGGYGAVRVRLRAPS